MNIRELINWGLVERVCSRGTKGIFYCGKGYLESCKQIVKERKKSELEPMLSCWTNWKMWKVINETNM